MWNIAIKFLLTLTQSLVFVSGLLFATQAHAAGETRVELLMAEEDGCIWCARWNAEIGHIYPKTEIGKAAPLRRINIHQPVPDDITLERPLWFTPTFVLLVGGVEKGRIEGYPGEDFFWGLVENMATENNVFTPR